MMNKIKNISILSLFYKGIFQINKQKIIYMYFEFVKRAIAGSL